MPESRVLEYNEKNLTEQKRLRREHASTTTTASKTPKGGAKDGAGGSTRGTRKDGPRGTKRSRDEVRPFRTSSLLLEHTGSDDLSSS